jgi:NitT/TauT family transport system substrate-binding protein
MWLATGIQKRSQGVNLVNIAQIIQKSALMLVAKKETGITKPEDFNNKKVGLWGKIFQLQPRAFFKKYNLNVKIIPQSYSVNLFLRDGVEVASAMWYNEYHTIINSGYNPDELVTFFFYDYGLNFPEDGLYMLEKNYDKDPVMCASFVKASAEGWEYAFAHPGEALDIVLNYMSKAYVPANKVHQEWMLLKMKDLMVLDKNNKIQTGLLTDDYYRVAEELKLNKMINKIPDFNRFYKKTD